MSTDKHILSPEIVEPKEPSSMKLVLSLGVAGLFSGIILVSTFIYTNPMILANKEAAIQRAIFNVLPDCASYTTWKLDGQKMVEKVAEADPQAQSNQMELLIYAGYNKQEELVGFAIPGSEPGFQDIIGAIYGYDATRKIIIGFEVLESKETPGLGDKIFKDAPFQTNFTSLSVDPEILAVKNGEKKQAFEVEAITGATISSKAVVRLLNKSMDIWQETIDDYMHENNLTISRRNE